MDIPILYEDEHLLVIDKPYGVVVNKADTTDQPTIQDWANEKIKNQKSTIKDIHGDFVHRSGIVHRLDKDTSGALLIAKTADIFALLQLQFAQRTVSKTYLTLVYGHLPSPSGSIELPIGRLPWNRHQFGVIPDGKPARTNYQVLETFVYPSYAGPDRNREQLRWVDTETNRSFFSIKPERFSYLNVKPETGRTHQIRVHLKYLGHPVVGDETYGARKRKPKDELFIPRMFLHAHMIEFVHPGKKEPVRVVSPLASDLFAVLRQLRLHNNSV